MSARLEELALRSSDLVESQRIRQLAKSYQLVALEHRNFLEDTARAA